MAGRISKAFGTRKASSQRIARTEVASAVQSAQVQGFAQTGVVEKTMWNTSLDDLVRDSHQIDGQITDDDGNFLLRDHVKARFPADPSLDAADRINCRCFVNPVFPDEGGIAIVAESAEIQAGQTEGLT
jgi:uncharacterized protein with gpF-like domain